MRMSQISLAWCQLCLHTITIHRGPYHPPGDLLQLFLLSRQSENPHQNYYPQETKECHHPGEKRTKQYTLNFMSEFF